MSGGKDFSILMVCTGNICRSPMAEGILRRELETAGAAGFRVASAGVAAMPGLPASTHAVMACAEIGIDISGHRSQPLTRRLVKDSDLVLTMEIHHWYAVREAAPDETKKIHLLSRYAAGSEASAPLGVDDPIGGDLEEYRSALSTIRTYVRDALPRIQAEIREAVREV